MRMTSTGALPRALAAARPPKPPPTITTRGVFDLCSSAPLIELRLASFINLFLKLLRPGISENLGFSRQSLDRGVLWSLSLGLDPSRKRSTGGQCARANARMKRQPLGNVILPPSYRTDS